MSSTSKAWLKQEPNATVKEQIKNSVTRIFDVVCSEIDLKTEHKPYVLRVIGLLQKDYPKWKDLTPDLHYTTNPIYSAVY